jgi:REP element-mobilizing transposase RayT
MARSPASNFHPRRAANCWERGRLVRIERDSAKTMTPVKATTLQKELREAGWHSRGYLPHFDAAEITQTVTFRLADSLPQAVLERWKSEITADSEAGSDSALRRRIEHYLDQGYGSCALKDASIATVVQESLLHFDGERYRLLAWVVMPNHVHVLLTPDLLWTLSQIMKNLKSYTSHEANKILGRSGPFWMEDYFDRYIRDSKHLMNASHIENNPVKVGLCERASDWRFSSARFREYPSI